MYAVLAAVCCDDCTGGPGKGTPATACPDGSAETATVTIAVTASPKAICNVTSWSCSDEDYCPNGLMKWVSGAPTCETCPFEQPVPNVTAGIGPAKCSIAWPTYTVAGNTECVDCGSTVESFTDEHSETFEVTLDCTAPGNTESFGTAGVDGISGAVEVVSCCDNCACGSPYLCSVLRVTVTAQWTKTIAGFPVIGTMTLDDCSGTGTLLCNDGSAATTDSVEFTLLTGAVVEFQRTVLNTQTATRLAPGSYTITESAATIGDGILLYQAAGVGIPSGSIPEGCLESTLTYYDTCSDSNLSACGFTITVSVA